MPGMGRLEPEEELCRAPYLGPEKGQRGNDDHCSGNADNSAYPA
jgi:hypothetical protein